MVTRAKFVEILAAFLDQDRQWLEDELQKCQRLRHERDDWAWYVFVQSYATNGGVHTWDSFLDQGGADLIHWSALFEGQPNDIDSAAGRLEAMSHQFINPRRASKTRPALLSTFRRFHMVGGPDRIARTWMDMRTSETLLGWLRTFAMIGESYSRNMCMDIAHPLVMSHFPLDYRVNTICDRIYEAPPSTPYAPREAWLRTLAVELGVSCWHLDRLLFNRHDELEAALNT
jgi:hypothetical protein